MNSKFIIPIILVLGLGIGLVQRYRLTALRQDAAMLRASAPRQLQSGPSRRNESRPEAMVGKTDRKSDSAASEHMAAIISIYQRDSALAEKWRNRATRTPEVTTALKDSLKRHASEMWPHIAALNHHQVMELIQRLQSDPAISPIDQSNIAPSCVERLCETNAAEALQLILKLEDLPEREKYFAQAFSRCAAENPGEAIRWFEEQSQKGNPVTKTPKMLQSMMLAEARYDPVRAVSRFLSIDTAADPDCVALLGSVLASELRDSGEHQAFLAALRRAVSESPALSKMRSEYVASLARNMHGWPIEDATALMRAEFTPSEIITASQLVSPGGLAEPERWATWFSHVNASASNKHPLVNFISSWSQRNPIAAGQWLDHAPPGALRNCAIIQYALLGADADSAHVARLVIILPESPERSRVLERVVAHWKAKDPAAALAFAKEQGLPE